MSDCRKALSNYYGKTAVFHAKITNIVDPKFIGGNENYDISTGMIHPARYYPEGCLIKPAYSIPDVQCYVLSNVVLVEHNLRVPVADHMYICEDLFFKDCKIGNKISFTATVENYCYQNGTYNYSIVPISYTKIDV